MDETLQLLDINLRNLRPDFYLQLNPPLTDFELGQLEVKYKLVLPADLKLLYKWKNGQADSCCDSFVNNSVFIPLDTALDSAKESTSMIGFDFEIENWWNENWIPIFNNGGGDCICYDCCGVFTGKVGQLIEFWHADNDRNVIAPSLLTFVEKINKYYETTEKSDFDEYFLVGLTHDYPKRFVVK